ncbi:MAG: U32 family peptidase [Bacilli bacterium]|nr:U32 family peptidase [Bacilli bacterium]
MKELLCPAGNMESLKYAVHNGADAVYLAGKKYGARKFANNFTNEELVEAIKYCHLYGVKIYVTVNTIIYEDELMDSLEYLRFLHENGVDAVIMQDIGLISLVRKYLPNLEIHASTQLHNHNNEQIKILKELGVTRVVLARELSIDEISAMNIDMEIEVFIHGALCISYSGQCLYSSMLLARSGNRGECAGLCRLPYSLEKNGKLLINNKFLLSPKELNTSYNLEKLMNSNVTSFKIEGRMKSPEYVGFITRYYRNLIDNYYKTHCINVDKQEEKKLKTLFNREFTKGYLFNENNKDLMNIDSSNHIGIYIGDVLEVTIDKIKIRLKDELNQEDGVRFVSENKGMIANFIYDKNMKLINKANSGDIIYLDNKIGLESNDKVNKTISKVLNDNIKKYQEKKILINVNFKANDNTFILELNDGENCVTKAANIIEIAKNRPTTKEEVIKQISKLGNTPFIIDNINGEYNNNSFIPIFKLNELRRELVEELISVRENKKKEVIVNNLESISKINNSIDKVNLSVLVRNEKQLKIVLNKKVDRIYVTDFTLYEKYKYQANVYYKIPRVNNNIDFNNEKLLISEYGSVIAVSHNNIITDYYLNVVNSAYVNYLLNKNVDLVTLSIELNNERLEELCKYINTSKVELVIYTKPEIMLIKNNLLTLYDKNYNQNNNYYLIDRNGSKYPINSDNDFTYLYYHKAINNMDNIYDYKRLNISNYRIELLDELEEEINALLDDFYKKVC